MTKTTTTAEIVETLRQFMEDTDPYGYDETFDGYTEDEINAEWSDMIAEHPADIIMGICELMEELTDDDLKTAVWLIWRLAEGIEDGGKYRHWWE